MDQRYMGAVNGNILVGHLYTYSYCWFFKSKRRKGLHALCCGCVKRCLGSRRNDLYKRQSRIYSLVFHRYFYRPLGRFISTVCQKENFIRCINFGYDSIVFVVFQPLFPRFSFYSLSNRHYYGGRIYI